MPNHASRTKGLLVVLVCASGIYWYLSSHIGDPTDDQHRVGSTLSVAQGTPRTTPRANARATEHRALLGAFSLLRHRPERMPHRLQVMVVTTLDGSVGGLRLRDAQYAPTPTGGVWVVYGRHIACIVQAPDGNVGCKPLSMTIKRGIVLGVGDHQGAAANAPHHFFIVGLSPDWAKAVRVRIGKNEIQTIPVRKNVYFLRAPELVIVERLER